MAGFGTLLLSDIKDDKHENSILSFVKSFTIVLLILSFALMTFKFAQFIFGDYWKYLLIIVLLIHNAYSMIKNEIKKSDFTKYNINHGKFEYSGVGLVCN
ncbi:MAG: hypothetical protein K5978_00830 [Campylobacter sp.]|nr:hypothetical protein [Campylobacter sp.]